MIIKYFKYYRLMFTSLVLICAYFFLLQSSILFLFSSSSQLFIGNKQNLPLNTLLDMNNFIFNHNCSSCCTKSPFMIAFIHSSSTNFLQRTVIRSTWASLYLQTLLKFRIVFLIGLTSNTTIQSTIDEEANIHKDIVQGNFNDNYKNLTYKHLMGYKWVLTFCDLIKFVMKVDDDAYVDIFQVISLLHSLHNTDNTNNTENTNNNSLQELIACSLFPKGSHVKRKGKWSLSSSDYPFDTLPAYCSGIAYFLTPDTVYSLYTASMHVRPFLWIDDLFITGILKSYYPSIKYEPINSKYTYSSSVLRKWLNNNLLNSSTYMIGDIGDIKDWQELMFKLWNKTYKVWIYENKINKVQNLLNKLS